MTEPIDWSSATLGELFDFSNGINAGKSAYGSGTPFINVLEVITKESLTLEDIPGRVTLPKSVLDRYRVKYGDVLLNRTSETQEEVGLTSVYLGSEPVVFGGFVFRAQPKGNHLHPRYAKYALRAIAVRNQITARGQGGIRANVGQRDLRSVVVLAPDKDEQLKIADALDAATNLISSLESLIDKKRAIKQGMMQELLTGRTRLPEFSDEWVDSTIGCLAKVFGGATPSTSIPKFWGGGIPWLTPAEISSAGSGVLMTSKRTITQDGLANSAARMLPAGTVLVTSRASIGNCAVAGVPLTTNQGFASLVPESPASTWFLYYWIQLHKSQLESMAAGSTFLEISARKVSSLPILVPTAAEQHAIGSAVRDADLELETLERRLGTIRNIKQGMMQELLTGRTRLVPSEVAS
jgi:type I restriction enzyme S subunit